MERKAFISAAPIDFPAEPLPVRFDLLPFTIQFLSLVDALHSRSIVVRWNVDHLVFDSSRKQANLAGFSSTRRVSDSREIVENAAYLLRSLRQFATGRHDGGQKLIPSLAKWERRKEFPLQGCLQELLRAADTPLDQLLCLFEWDYTREIQLMRGLVEMAKQSRGRAILFNADAGEGKSTLLRQFRRNLHSIHSHVFQIPIPPHEDSTCVAYSLLSNALLPRSTADDSVNPDDPDEWIRQFWSGIDRHTIDGAPVVFLIDDLHHADRASLGLFTRLLRQLQSRPVLLVFTSRHEISGISDLIVTLPLQSPSPSTLHSALHIPFWKPEQRKNYVDQMLRRTSSNSLLFHEYLRETLRQRRNEMKWVDGHWQFASHSIPQFPATAAEFYLASLPSLTDQEFAFLQMGSVQGESFDPRLVIADDAVSVVRSLVQKQVLLQTNGKLRFRKPFLAGAIYSKMEKLQQRDFHLNLAEQLLRLNRVDVYVKAARHFLQGGNPKKAVHLLLTAVERLGNRIGNEALAISTRLEECLDDLPAGQQLQFHRMKGNLLFTRGNYDSAANSYRSALSLLSSGSEVRFDVIVQLAQSHVLNNNILVAQKLLNDNGRELPASLNPNTLFHYYLTRALCNWHRASSDNGDFDRALAIAEKNRDFELMACGYRHRAKLALRDCRLDDAKNMARKALKYAQRTHNFYELGHLYEILGSLAWRQSRHRAAEHWLKRSIKILRKGQHDHGIASAWNLLGNLYVEQYRFDEAIEAFEHAIALFSQLDHPHEISIARFNMGLVFLEQGRLKEAERIFLRCKAVDKEAGNRRFYAYDIRALGVQSTLRGFRKKASKLLRRSLDIFQDLAAEGDVIQTKLILLLNELEQKNYRQAAPLVEFFLSRHSQIHEPMTRAEVHFLLAYYYGSTNENETAQSHLRKSMHLAKRIRYYKLMGQNHVLKLILRNSPPRPKDVDISRAIHFFRKGKTGLEFHEEFLKLYQAYPSLLQHSPHGKRLALIESTFRKVQHRSHHRTAAKLLRGRPSRSGAAQPRYRWWSGLLGALNGNEGLETRLSRVLEQLTTELKASYGALLYLNERAIFDRVVCGPATSVSPDLPSAILEILLRKPEHFCAAISDMPQLARQPWSIVHEVRSILAVPMVEDGRVTGCWYFERRNTEPPFDAQDLDQAAFFATAAGPAFRSALQAEFTERFRRASVSSGNFSELVGKSKPMQQLFQNISKLAPVDVSILISGESGTGKELVARTVHRLSKRASGPFLALNCSAIPETLIESELFGHSKGAFTGAVSAKPGFIERANGGTLFLDEIGDLSAGAQAKLLRVLQEREIQRLGETSVRKVDVRFLFATHKDLRRLVQQGMYRQDLFYRVHVSTIEAPPLRERRDDIPMLVMHFVDKYKSLFGKEDVRFSSAAMKLLCDYTWPGNVRELENVVQSVLIHAENIRPIEPDDFPAHLSASSMVNALSGLSLEEGKQRFEREFVKQALDRNGWNKTRTAKDLKISRQGLLNLMNRLNLQSNDD